VAQCGTQRSSSITIFRPSLIQFSPPVIKLHPRFISRYLLLLFRILNKCLKFAH